MSVRDHAREIVYGIAPPGLSRDAYEHMIRNVEQSLDEYASSVHAADPVRKAAREYIDARDVRIALDEDPLSLANSFIDPCLLEDVKLAALRAALEG
jgi:histone H3/H4